MRRLVAALFAFALLAPGTAHAYQWPLKPFNQPHPIRGYFNDPRIGEGGGTGFHFGIDIHAADFTPVYSVSPGRVHATGQSVTVRVSPQLSFGYWHILPAVLTGKRVKTGQVVGWVHPYWDHVHLAELRNGVWVNPLRPGALTPFVDTTKPVIEGIGFSLGNTRLDASALAGRVDLVVNAYDPESPPLAPGKWGLAKLAPAYIRWRVLSGETEVLPWSDAFDGRYELLPSFMYDLHYAPGTRQNKAWAVGRLFFYLARDFDTLQLPNAGYTIEVEASDLANNTTVYRTPITISNPALPVPVP